MKAKAAGKTPNQKAGWFLERPQTAKRLSSLSGQAIVWRAKWSHLVISSSNISPREEAVCISPQFRHLSYKFTMLGDFWTMPAVREPFPWHFPHNLIWKGKIKLNPTQNCQPSDLKEFDKKKKSKKKIITLRKPCSLLDEEITCACAVRRNSKAHTIGQRMNVDRISHRDISSQKHESKWRLNSLSFFMANFWVLLILGRKVRLHLNVDQLVRVS